MNRLYAIVLTLVFASPLLSYANGDDSLTDKTHGGGKNAAAQWHKADDQIDGKIAKIQMTKMKATVETLHSFLQDGLGGKGLTAVWRGQYSAEKGSQLTYGIQCNFGNASLSITVNDLNPVLGHLTVNHQDFQTIPAAGIIRNECPYFEPGVLLVTARPDVLPYTPITRKEYLLIVEHDLNNSKAREIAAVKERTPVRSAEEQAAGKKRDLEAMTAQYSGSELQMRTKMYLDQYKSDEDYLKENIDKATADVDTAIHFIDGMLNRLAPATLNAPAVVSPDSKEFEGFRDGEPGMVMLVRSNPSFFEPGAAEEKPQFFVITWNADASANALGNTITKELDTHLLKTLLTK